MAITRIIPAGVTECTDGIQIQTTIEAGFICPFRPLNSGGNYSDNRSNLLQSSASLGSFRSRESISAYIGVRVQLFRCNGGSHLHKESITQILSDIDVFFFFYYDLRLIFCCITKKFGTSKLVIGVSYKIKIIFILSFET